MKIVLLLILTLVNEINKLYTIHKIPKNFWYHSIILLRQNSLNNTENKKIDMFQILKISVVVNEHLIISLINNLNQKLIVSKFREMEPGKEIRKLKSVN